MNLSLALRPHRVGIEGYARLAGNPRASLAGFGQHRDPAQHQVRRLQALARAHERSDRGARHGQHALPEQRIAHRLMHQTDAAPPIVEGDALFADQPAGARHVMVAEVFADAGERMAHLDAKPVPSSISIWFSRCSSFAPTSTASAAATRSPHAPGSCPRTSCRCSLGAPQQLPKLLPTRWCRSRWSVLISGPGCAACGASGARHLVTRPPQAQLESATREVLAGLVERVTFHNAENGFCVLRIKARGHRELITVIGHAAVIAAGEWVTASGEWVNDRTHGQQFKSRFMRTSAPTSIEGIEKYLGSGMIRGIGPAYARKMVRAFGENVFDVIEAEPDRLREVTGIGPVRAKRITGAWAEQKIVREIMVFLHSHGVGTARAVRIFKTYGADAVQVMTENPYRLARDIRGIGFKTADAIAMKLGIEKTAMIRVRAGISYALTEGMDDGHCGLPTDELTPLAVELLEVPAQLIQTALDLELAERTVVADTVGETACIFLAGLYRAEQVIAERILRLVIGTLPWPYIDPEKALPWIEQKTGLSLAESQVAAIRLALLSKVLVITGGPGVGKTTIVNSILRILAAKGVSLLLWVLSALAPAGDTSRDGVRSWLF